ncbi:hypothetical protein OOT46_22835 [Aquabacterium sp. A7-Y]|uniref:hypothetical protein n=1 Tax=Aquabacterium sp. A7-Y TaxID=1349605 RepID=UPI00223CA78C|nr:hypothetical protein [Aquabacterium sp. A7-Y]MCW7540659.1 hypothetical protein [Aquabacterium sp. A7-Y]
MPSQFNCLRYWDLSNQIRLDDAIALWCNVDPAELGRLGYDTHCMSAKRAALVTALRDGLLEYEDLGIPTGRGRVIMDAPLDELLEKDRLLIKKPSLRRWFEQLPFEDRPAFLFDESRQPVLPDGSEAAEMNSLKAIAVMAHLLARSAPGYRTGERPNAEQIGKAVAEVAQQLFGDDVRGFKSFHKKVGEALKVFNRELPKRSWET